MAPPIDDFTFLMLCVKHSPEKLTPNFEAVAKEAGKSSSGAAYQRLWAIRKKYGLPMNKAGSGPRKTSSASPTATIGVGGGVKKRGRPAKAACKTNDEELEEDKAKPEYEEESDEAGTPTKKAKTDDTEDSKAAKTDLK